MRFDIVYPVLIHSFPTCRISGGPVRCEIWYCLPVLSYTSITLCTVFSFMSQVQFFDSWVDHSVWTIRTSGCTTPVDLRHHVVPPLVLSTFSYTCDCCVLLHAICTSIFSCARWSGFLWYFVLSVMLVHVGVSNAWLCTVYVICLFG